MSVARRLIQFLSQQERFEGYRRPTSADYKEAPASKREQLIRKWTLVNALANERQVEEFDFAVTKQDLLLAQVAHLDFLRKVTLMDYVSEIEQIRLHLEAGDFI